MSGAAATVPAVVLPALWARQSGKQIKAARTAAAWRQARELARELAAELAREPSPRPYR